MNKPILIACLLVTNSLFSQDTMPPAPKTVIYSIAFNSVPDQFNFPLIGFVNLAQGSHKGAQIGFVNRNKHAFKGAQVGFVNTVGDKAKGSQIGFVNTAEALKGLQLGFVNVAAMKARGSQIGFINTTEVLKGFQLGFINIAAKRGKGSQIGFINKTKTLRGFQLGFINYADTLHRGIPLGFLSIVKKGGYQAFEIAATEMYPVNLSFKMGVKKLYTSFVSSYNPALAQAFAVGVGFGAIMPVSEKIYFSPELLCQNPIAKDNYMIVSFAANVGYRITPRVEFTVAPSIAWNYADRENNQTQPFFSVFQNTINQNSNLIVGLRAALRYNLIH